MGRGYLGGVALVLLLGATSVGAAGASAGGPRSCGPSSGKTVLAAGRVRVYAVTRLTGPARHPFEVPLVFGCLAPRGHPRLMGSDSSGLARYRGRWVGLVESEAIAVRAPWVAYPLLTSGVDTSTLSVVGVDLRTNARRYCPVGGNQAPQPAPSLARVAVARDGAVAWAGEGKTGQSIIGPTVPRVVACGATGAPVVLDEGEGIDVESLSLSGSTLTWKHSGELRSAQLP